MSTTSALSQQLCADLRKGEKPLCDIDSPGNCDLAEPKFALVIGNNKYPHFPPGLINAENDAKEFAKILASDYGFKVRCILNATLAEANTEFFKLAAVAANFGANEDRAKKSRLVFYYSGHGLQQSSSNDGSLVFVDATKQNPHGSSKTVNRIREMLASAAGIVAPIFLIDACRIVNSALPSTAPAANPIVSPPLQPGMRSNVDNPYEYFIGYAVPIDDEAQDNESRFTPYILKEMSERGRTFWMIWDETRREYMRARNLVDVRDGPQSSPTPAFSVDTVFRSGADDRCDLYFNSTWRTIRQTSRSKASIRHILASSYEPDDFVCDGWSDALKRLGVGFDVAIPNAECNSACGKALKCRFDPHFLEPCRKKRALITELDVSDIPPPITRSDVWYENQRLEQVVATGARSFDIGIRSPGGGRGPASISSDITASMQNYRAPGRFITSPNVWNEVVTMVHDTGLRTLPLETEKPHTPISAGTPLEVDCKSLICGPDWIGVRYQLPGQSEPWRGFVPRSEIEPSRPDGNWKIRFDDGSSEPTENVASQVASVMAIRKGKPTSRIRVTARFEDNSSDADATFLSRQQALLRLSAVDEILRKQGAYNTAGLLPPKFELQSLPVGGFVGADVPDVAIEFYSDRAPDHLSAPSPEYLVLAITSVTMLDNADELSSGDIFARVTIDGDTQTTGVVQGRDAKPNWEIRKPISSRSYKVKLEIIDKDVSTDDPVDINGIDNKRDLEFLIDTKTCKIEGFASTYKCGTVITRTGKESKKAEITFELRVE